MRRVVELRPDIFKQNFGNPEPGQVWLHVETCRLYEVRQICFSKCFICHEIGHSERGWGAATVQVAMWPDAILEGQWIRVTNGEHVIDKIFLKEESTSVCPKHIEWCREERQKEQNDE